MLYARLMSLAMLGFVSSAIAQIKLGVMIATCAVGAIIGLGALHLAWLMYLHRAVAQNALWAFMKLLVYVPISLWAFLVYGMLFGWDKAVVLMAVAMIGGAVGKAAA